MQNVVQVVAIAQRVSNKILRVVPPANGRRISFDMDDSIEMTGENEPLKIMSTIVAVIKEFIATPEYNKGNLKFVFEGTRKGAEFLMPMEKPTARTKLYTRFLKKNMPPGTKVEEIGNVVKFEVPSEDNIETPEGE